MKQAKRAMAALALAATLAAGGAAVAIAGPTVAGAAEAAATGTVSRIGNVLSGLVSDGTITQTQADAVQKALDAAKPQGMGERHGGMGERRGPGGMPGAEAVASALGMTTDEIRTALQSGQSLAQVAASKGVSTQTVVDAIVADLKTHLAEEVASGEHTQAEVDQMLSKATERITAVVNGEMPIGPGGPGGHGRGRGGPFGERGEGKAPSAPTSTTTS